MATRYADIKNGNVGCWPSNLVVTGKGGKGKPQGTTSEGSKQTLYYLTSLSSRKLVELTKSDFFLCLAALITDERYNCIVHTMELETSWQYKVV